LTFDILIFTYSEADRRQGQAYSVTKAAQIHLVKALAMTAGPKIRVNSVSPGILLTVSIGDPSLNYIHPKDLIGDRTGAINSHW
jgi:NAD(P)-dependent dehydrogenase (short-subunit alcohol dehydrogenase family)